MIEEQTKPALAAGLGGVSSSNVRLGSVRRRREPTASHVPGSGRSTRERSASAVVGMAAISSAQRRLAVRSSAVSVARRTAACWPLPRSSGRTESIPRSRTSPSMPGRGLPRVCQTRAVLSSETERVTGIEPASPAWKIGQPDFGGRWRSVSAGHSVSHTASDDLGFPRPRDGRAMETVNSEAAARHSSRVAARAAGRRVRESRRAGACDRRAQRRTRGDDLVIG